jgi:hypothetical protein
MVETRKFRWREFFFILGFLLSLVITFIFAIRAVRAMPRPHIDEPIRSWMSVTYIARSYRVPANYLYDALGIPDKLHDRRPISQIAREQNRTLESVILSLQDAIVHARPPYPTPVPLPPPTPTGSAP